MPPLVDWFDWNKDCMLFLMGGFNNYIDSMLEVASLSSFLPLEPFLDETCFFN
jgi:hypothetical protein